ncbi:CBS domain-containing protein [Dokdonella koreensis]|uniref:Signal transduction protein n=1 Tax=Dokdonella koreensis DS-123 TaxID=1300342 RepID=A0A167GSU8_9GAMM|nr:CBS domain-containing protein [Dokdonella koreensis]ANB17456.1 Signal transduction protein [Dokdonella koreensis DS-123]
MILVRQLLNDKGNAIYSVAPDAPVLAAIRTMAEHNVGALLVLRDGVIVGMVSERDYTRKIILKGRSSADTPVSDIMSSPVITVSSADSVGHCMHVCTRSHVRHLPVIDDGEIVGVLSIGDLVKAVISEQAEEIEQLQRYIAG